VTNTFGTPGALEHAYFLRNVPDAIRVQQRIKGQLELASLPGLSDEEIKGLLHVIVVGGGPTGVEIAAELSDLLNGQMSRVYPRLADKFRVVSPVCAVIPRQQLH
jgi:NADH:ubiquinone reductase (non-electrogenic)